MKRVLIIGCAGSGKTTFAQQVSKHFNLPLIHLDYYYHQREYSYYSDKTLWVQKVKQLATSDRWIIDGNYTSSLADRLDRADTVFFLDYPRRVYLLRLLKRRVQNKKRYDMPSDWRERIGPQFLIQVLKYKNIKRPFILSELAKHRDVTLITLSSPRQAKDYLESLADF